MLQELSQKIQFRVLDLDYYSLKPILQNQEVLNHIKNLNLIHKTSDTLTIEFYLNIKSPLLGGP